MGKLNKQYLNASVCQGKNVRELITYLKDRLSNDQCYVIDTDKSNNV